MNNIDHLFSVIDTFIAETGQEKGSVSGEMAGQSLQMLQIEYLQLKGQLDGSRSSARELATERDAALARAESACHRLGLPLSSSAQEIEEGIRLLVADCDKDYQAVMIERDEAREKADEFAMGVFCLNASPADKNSVGWWWTVDTRRGESVVEYLYQRGILEKHPENDWYRKKQEKSNDD